MSTTLLPLTSVGASGGVALVGIEVGTLHGLHSLERDGFEVVRVLSVSEATALRDEYGRRHGWGRIQHAPEQPPFFEGDFWNDDVEYRTGASGAIVAATSTYVTDALDGFDPVGGSYLVKWPSPADHPVTLDVPATFHQDTVFVDERRGDRSYMLWLATQPIDEENGAMVVVPGSHRVDRTYRGLDFEAPWLRHAEVLAATALTIRLDAGEALLFDPAIVHRTLPNRGAEPRVVATTLVVNRDAPLAYFRAVDDHTVERVPVPRNFFQSGRMSELPVRPGDQRRDAPCTDFDEGSLKERLDRARPTEHAGDP